MDALHNHTQALDRPMVAVVADDLTGAADTAMQFLPPGGQILLFETANPPTDPMAPVYGWALNTVSRAAGENECRNAVRNAADLISGRNFRLIYKKVDSQMRGRPGLEIDTLRRALNLESAFIVPALPEQERQTQDGIHLVHGVPVAQGEAGRDPVTPVRESDLVRMTAGQSGTAAGLVSWRVLDQGQDRVIDRIETLRVSGVPLIVFDTLHRDHLNLIAGISLDHYPLALLAGSAGLAQSVADHLNIEHNPVVNRLPSAERLLFICGSLSQVLRRQAKALAASARIEELVITPDVVSEHDRWTGFLQHAACLWEKKNLIIRLSEKAFTMNPSDLLDPLSELALTLISAHRPDGLFLSGGDTARAVLLRSGVRVVKLKGPAAPGIARGEADQGRLHGAALATKAGAFGRDNLLLDLYNKWIKDNKNGK